VPVLSVEVDATALERVRADVLVVGVAPEDRPLRGCAAHADWRLCGQLSRLIASGHLTGARAEASLVVANAGFSARMVLLIGLGPRRALDARAWNELGHDAVDRALGLCAQRIALGVLDSEEPDEALRVGVSELLSGAARALTARNTDARLSLLGPVDRLGVALRAVPAAVVRGVDLQRAASGAERATPVAPPVPSSAA
jgi:hypothetical protein